MTTLLDYADTYFPNHVTEPLTDGNSGGAHAAVAEVIGYDKVNELVLEMRTCVPGASVGVMMLRPSTLDQRLVGDGRVVAQSRVAACVGGGILPGLATGLIIGMISGSAALAVLVGAFAMLLVAAAIGERDGTEGTIDTNPMRDDAEATPVALVGVFTDVEADAAIAADAMEALHPRAVRMLPIAA